MISPSAFNEQGGNQVTKVEACSWQMTAIKIKRKKTNPTDSQSKSVNPQGGSGAPPILSWNHKKGLLPICSGKRDLFDIFWHFFWKVQVRNCPNGCQAWEKSKLSGLDGISQMTQMTQSLTIAFWTNYPDKEFSVTSVCSPSSTETLR